MAPSRTSRKTGCAKKILRNWAMGLLLILLLALPPIEAHDFAREDERRCETDKDCNSYEGCRSGTCRCFPPWKPQCTEIVLEVSIPCTNDIECVLSDLSFSQCISGSCACLPGYRLWLQNSQIICELNTAEVTISSTTREYPKRPSTDADYSGVVKLALGAAIVMLAGVILALVWNLYREKRRLARGVAQSGRRIHGRSGGRRAARPPPPQDLPPNYNDIFIISAESGHRHEKPPSYEEAMRDQQFVPSPGYVNFGFTNDITTPSSSMPPPVRTSSSHVVDMNELGTRSPITSLSSFACPPAAPSGNNTSLNVASIISRLRPSFLAEPSRSPSTPSGLLGLSMESPCRRAVQGLSEPSIRRTMPKPPVTIRRTKSGRVSDNSNDFIENREISIIEANQMQPNSLTALTTPLLLLPSENGAESLLSNSDQEEQTIKTTSDNSNDFIELPNENREISIIEANQKQPNSVTAFTTPLLILLSENGAERIVYNSDQEQQNIKTTSDGLVISEVPSHEIINCNQSTSKECDLPLSDNHDACDIQDVNMNLKHFSDSIQTVNSPQENGEELDNIIENNNNNNNNNNSNNSNNNDNSLLILQTNANAELPLGILHPTTVASDC